MAYLQLSDKLAQVYTVGLLGDILFLRAGLVAQSVMSATDMLGHRYVRGLSAIDPLPRQWMCITKPKDVGMPL